MKKNLYIAFGFLFFLQGYAQEKKEEKMQNMLLDSLKKYEYEPLYQIEIFTNYAYRVKVNDIPVKNNFTEFLKNTKFNINSAILYSGKQNLSIEIYPEYIDKNKQKEYLDNQGTFKLIVSQTAWRKDGGGQEEPKIILEYELPKENKHTGNTIDYAKLKSFTDSLSFEASVPYHLQGWTNGEVFKEEDSLQLKAQVVDFYKKIINLYNTHNFKELYQLSKLQEYELAQYNYFTKDLIISNREKFNNTLPKNRLKMLPLENYKLEFYANNRVLALVRVDNPFKYKSAIIGEKEDIYGNNKIVILNKLLYRPIGSSQFQIIR
ncbi:hypothetical protein [Apibacter adventoris]|uniref:Uncharacterized protein n=1 Tax=Apibacter adventoris TaxID=1679466 RepID=A0A2S8AA97_9FLAO|nr:hypothetical protein [Apibacter adventoris]PQL91515.1 hypothetical protein C4S77_06800 [Apibacter adventoris]